MQINNKVTIKNHSGFWYDVEDLHIDAGCEGCTISYWEMDGDERHSYICMDIEEALAIADAIYKLFNN